MIVYLLWRLAIALIRVVPTRRSHALAAFLANLVFICWREKRRNTIDNMRHVFPDPDDGRAQRVARDSWRNYGIYLVDFLRAADGRAGNLSGTVEFEGRTLVDEAF